MQQFLRSVDGLAAIFAGDSPQHILLVTGAQSYTRSGARKMLTPLLDGYHVTHFVASPNPNLAEITTLLQQSEGQSYDTVLAVGGGSAIDTAKAVRILLAQDTDAITKIVTHNTATKDPHGRFVCIPTTAGSGAESTHFAVVYVDKLKYALSHRRALADIVVLDPRLTESMPAHVAASAGMDAIAQAIEAYWSVRSTKVSRQFSKQALEKLLPNYAQSVQAPTVYTRQAMLEGANLAGQAINIAQTTAPHALSYGFTANYGLAHGEAVGLTLPFFADFNAAVTEKNCQDQRGVAFVHERMNELAKLFGLSDARQLGVRLESLISSADLPRTVSVPSITKAVRLLTKSVGMERLRNNPRVVTPNDIETILEKIVQ